MTGSGANAHTFRVSRVAWRRFVISLKDFTASEQRGKAVALVVSLLVLMVGVNGLNVINSYVGRDFMSAIENRDTARYLHYAALYVVVFAISSIVAALFRFAEERLGLLWREWLTARLVGQYLEPPVYHRLNEMARETDEVANPDQRIAEDVRALTVSTLSFILMILNSTVTIGAFSGVLWSISPRLLLVAVVYALVGSLCIVLLGHRLVRLNYDQLDREAIFRTDLVHVRENAESVAMLRRESRLQARVLRHLSDLANNLKRIIAVNRNVNAFTAGYNYLIQLIPPLFVAPLFVRGDVEFGVITQAAMAFAALTGAFSLVVTQFPSLSSLGAVITRLDSLVRGIDQARSARTSAIEFVDDETRLAYEELTLRSPTDARAVVNGLSISIPPGFHVLVRGPNTTGKIALFRATSGIWEAGAGRIFRPAGFGIKFVPERPYLPPGTLRELLLRTGSESEVSDDRILTVLRLFDLEAVFKRAGGLDIERDWHDILALGEQQLLAFARVVLYKPSFVFLDRVTTALTPEQVAHALRLLRGYEITYITVGGVDDRLTDYDAILEIDVSGEWTLIPIGDGPLRTPSTAAAR